MNLKLLSWFYLNYVKSFKYLFTISTCVYKFITHFVSPWVVVDRGGIVKFHSHSCTKLCIISCTCIQFSCTCVLFHVFVYKFITSSLFHEFVNYFMSLVLYHVFVYYFMSYTCIYYFIYLYIISHVCILFHMFVYYFMCLYIVSCFVSISTSRTITGGGGRS